MRRPWPFGSGATLVVLLGGSAHAAPVEPAARTYDGPAAIDGDSNAIEPTPDIDKIAPPRQPSGEPSIPPAELEPLVFGRVEAPSPPMSGLRRHRLVYRNLTAIRANPPGLVNDFTVGYRYQLVNRDTLLFRDSFVFLGLDTFVTPAFARVGPTIEIQPAAVLNLSATYDFVGFYGILGQVQSFRSPTTNVGPDDLLRMARQDKRHYATWGHLVQLAALVQAKYRQVALRNKVNFAYAAFRLRRGDTVFFDYSTDIMHPNYGWSMTNDTDLVWVFEKLPLVIAIRHTLTTAFYTQRMFLPGEPVSNPNGPTSRLGPAIVWTLYDRPGARVNRPSIIFLSQWWLRHRYRTGVQTNAALPYLVVGVSFEGDLLPERRRRKAGTMRRR
jgi:hypothetical protein